MNRNEWWRRSGAEDARAGEDAEGSLELCSCPECGMPAEVVTGAGRSGGDEMVGVRCVRRHWFFGLRDRLVA